MLSSFFFQKNILLATRTQYMSVVLSVGTLSIASLAVLVIVSVTVFPPMFILLRSKSQVQHHCCRCHSPVYVSHVMIPPYYLNSRPRLDSLYDGVLRKSKEVTKKTIDSNRSGISSKNDQKKYSTADQIQITFEESPTRSRRTKSGEIDFKFQRSCSTRKKIHRRVSVSKNSQGVIGTARSWNLFR